MYKCTECGNLFEEGEQATWEERHGLDSPPYETMSGCPICKGDYEEVYQCDSCGDWHTEDELYDGWCEKCLRETINYDTFFEYCEANKDEQYLESFVMFYLMGGMDCPKFISFDFHLLMIDTYKARVEAIKAAITEEYRKCIDILPDCIRFIMDDDGSSGRENYAEWLNNHYGKINASKIDCGNLDVSKIKFAE